MITMSPSDDDWRQLSPYCTVAIIWQSDRSIL